MRFAALATPAVDVGAVQTIRRACLLLTVAFVCLAFMFGTSHWSHQGRETIQWIGLGLIGLCIGGRAWCALYIGGGKTSAVVATGPYSLCRNPLYLFSAIRGVGGRTWCALYIGGRKTSALVTTGPYSLCRNPLYLFSAIGAVGVGAQLGAVSVAVLAGLLAWAAHVPEVLQEERLLLVEHGDRYRGYLARVPRFLPQLDGWRNVPRLEVCRGAVTRTFVDACYFLAAAPVAASIEYLQHAGLIRVFLHLP